jgi:hypothetical protein
MLSNLETAFRNTWILEYPELILQEQLCLIKERRFRFDFAHVESKVIIELQGKVWRTGRHNTGTGLISSYEKLNLAAFYNYTCFQLSKEMINGFWINKIATTILNKLTQMQ